MNDISRAGPCVFIATDYAAGTVLPSHPAPVRPASRAGPVVYVRRAEPDLSCTSGEPSRTCCVRPASRAGPIVCPTHGEPLASAGGWDLAAHRFRPPRLIPTLAATHWTIHWRSTYRRDAETPRSQAPLPINHLDAFAQLMANRWRQPAGRTLQPTGSVLPTYPAPRRHSLVRPASRAGPIVCPTHPPWYVRRAEPDRWSAQPMANRWTLSPPVPSPQIIPPLAATHWTIHRRSTYRRDGESSRGGASVTPLPPHPTGRADFPHPAARRRFVGRHTQAQ